MSVTVTLNGNIQFADSTGLTAAKILAGLVFSGTALTEAQALSLVADTATAIALPVSPCEFLYLKNTGSANPVQVTWTPNGGSSNIVVSLVPGSAILLIEVASGGGISALSLFSASGTTVEYILAG